MRPYDTKENCPSSMGQEYDVEYVPTFTPGWERECEPEYDGEKEDPVQYTPTDPPEWSKEHTRQGCDVTTRLEKAVEAAEVDWEEASKRLFKAKNKLYMHKLFGEVKARMVKVEAAGENGKCCICLRGDADPDDCPYCEDCDQHVQNVSKHSPHRQFFDVSPIAWDEWWVPGELYNRLMAHSMLTSEGKLKQEVEF